MIELGKTTDIAVMAIVVKHGGVVLSPDSGTRYEMFFDTDLERAKEAAYVRSHVNKPDTNHTLYLPADAKLTLEEALLLWREVDRRLKFADNKGVAWRYSGADGPQWRCNEAPDWKCITSGALTIQSRKLTLVPPAPPERDVFKDPRKDDRIKGTHCGVYEVIETARNGLVFRHTGYNDAEELGFKTMPQWADLQRGHTVVARGPDKEAGDE